MRQASWLLDIEIAATAFAAGLDVATENRADFEALADALAALFPDAPALAVRGEHARAGIYLGNQPSRYRVGSRSGNRAYACIWFVVSCSTPAPWRSAAWSTL